jgi:HlyD family secretion protein
MRRRSLVINGVLAVVLVGTMTGGWLAIGSPSAATAATSQTTRVTRGTITSTVTASGNSASADTRDVDFAGSGTISEIFVKAGARVTKGARLARLDDVDAKATLRTARASLAGAQANLVTTETGQTSAERASGAAQVSAQQVSVDNASAQLTAANQSYALDKTQQNAAVSEASASLADARTELTGDQARLKTAQAALARANAANDANAKQTAQTDVTSYQSQVTQDETTASQSRSALAQAERTRESTLLKDSQAVTTAAGQLAAARKQLASQQASAVVEAQPPKAGTVASAKAQVETAQVQVDSAQTALEETVLLAPMSGTVAAVNGTVGGSSGGSASTGSSSAAESSTSSTSSSSSSGFITLTNVSSLQVTADVAEADAVKVKLGQPATATFSAAGLSVAGTVTAMDVQQTVTNNVVTYGMTITLTNPPGSLRIGQSASIRIVAETKASVLRAASNAVTTLGNRSTVTVRRNGKDQVVSVQTGLVGDGGTEITSGVAEGDTLVVPSSTGGTGAFTFPGGGVGGGLGGGGVGRR